MLASSYVGIAGASNGDQTTTGGLIPGFAETRVTGGGAYATNYLCAGGVLFINGEKPKTGPRSSLSVITDGSSKTLLIGEQSDYLIDTSGNQQVWASGGQKGFLMGALGEGTPPMHSYFSGNSTGNSNFQSWNTTTIRWKINTKTGWNGSSNGVFGTWAAENVPLLSAHPGGAFVAMADGSVTLLDENTQMDVLARLATRDDGQPTGYAP